MIPLMMHALARLFPHSVVVVVLGAIVVLAPRLVTAQIPTPEAHFGFRMGDDGRLAAADQIEEYFQLVASRSDRIKIVDVGPTTAGRRTIAAIVSAPENIRNLERIREANQRLADPRSLSPEEARQIAATHPAVLAIGCGIHASEVGATQTANELLYTLASANDPSTLAVLQQVVLILIPSLNPDGYRLVVDWYNTHKGTRYDGGPMPWPDHLYVGHDINRDGFMMNMAESRNLSRFFYTEWHPQVFLAMHQMPSAGVRFFVPPNVDPIDPNYDPLIWRQAALLGSAMALELERDQHSGVVSNALFDYYWPGYEDSVPLGHNTVCLLIEAASVRVASPVTIEAGELRAGERGLAEYTPQINFPNPWPGGKWTLRHIVDYNLSAVRGLLKAVSAYREPIVQNFYDIGARAVEAGKRGSPFAFIIPPEQHDSHAARKLEELLLQGGIEIFRALEAFRADGVLYPAGSDVILLAQPFRAYVKTLLERQQYPVRRTTPGGAFERPFDAAGWSLPLQMGVDVRTVVNVFQPPPMVRVVTAITPPAKLWSIAYKTAYYVVDARGTGGAIATNRLLAAGLNPSWLTRELEVAGYSYPVGSLAVPYSFKAALTVGQMVTRLGLRADAAAGRMPAATRPISRARVALHKPWTQNVDEGWTRWLLEQYEFPFTSVTDADIRSGNLRAQYDAIILPSAPARQLLSGHPANLVPPEYAGGLGEEGLAALIAFVQAGGTLICLDRAGELAINAFQLPIRDVARDAPDDQFFCPGSILRIDLDPSDPLSYGMQARTAGFFSFSSAYEVDNRASTIRTAARYGASNLLLSGWLQGESVIAGRSAVVRATVGAGQVVLLGFRVQHRGQSLATFRLLFNSIFIAS
jgi:hypothetical protein